MSKLSRSILVIILFSLGLSLWLFIVEPATIVTNKLILKVPNWHEELNGLKVAVIADIHAGSPFIDENKLHKIVELTNNEQPDLVVLPGDFVIQDVIGGKFIPPETIANILGKLKAPCGVIAVLGNHDWWLDGERITKALEKNNITVLENNAIQIKKDNKIFWVAGLADLWTRKPDIKRTLNYITDNNPIILLTHNPDTFKDVPSRVSLTLAGHTHGCGQISLCFWGKVGLPFMDKQYRAAGYLVEQGRHLFISSGIGTSEVPIRFGTLPEIVIIKLESKD